MLIKIHSKILFLFCFFLFFFLPVKISNADSLSLSISPSLIKITNIAPSTVETPIILSNLSSNGVSLRINIKPITASAKANGQVEFLTGQTIPGQNPQFAKNIHIADGDTEPETLTLSPKQKKQIFLKITIDKNEPSSDYYFAVVFSSIPTLSDEKKPSFVSNISAGVAVNVLLSINPAKAQASIEEFSAPYLLNQGPVPFTLKIKNEGTNLISVKGNILIRNLFGQLIGKVDFSKVNILKDSKRLVSPVWPETFLLGPYTATLTLAVSDQGPIFSQTIYFFAFPIQVLLAVLLAIIIILLIRNRLKTISR